MRPKARMIIALVALVASMTAAALILAWLEPSDGPRKLAWSAQRIEGFVRSAVASAEHLAPNAWRGVEIVLGHERDAWRGRTLTALVPGTESHFRIAEGGQVHALPAWRDQRFDNAGGAIRIAVSGTPETSSVPPEQWVSLRALLVELKMLAAPHDPNAETWSVSLSDESGEGLPLRFLLVNEGFIG